MMDDGGEGGIRTPRAYCMPTALRWLFSERPPAGKFVSQMGKATSQTQREKLPRTPTRFPAET